MFKTLVLIAILINQTYAYTYYHTTVINNQKDEDTRIYKECIKPGAFTKYIFFSENKNDTNIYVIKTKWVVLHPKLIKNTLKAEGAYLYDSNPSTKCEWIQNKEYEWSSDTVLFQGNITSNLNNLAIKATDRNATLEWCLIFSWAIIPSILGLFALICIPLYEYIKEIYKNRKTKAPNNFDRHFQRNNSIQEVNSKDINNTFNSEV